MECEKLYRRLRSSNNRQEKKIKDAKRSWASGSSVPKPYKYAHLMTFLIPFVKKRK